MTDNIETKRLLLCAAASTDLTFISSLIADTRVRNYLGGPVPLSRRDATARSYLSISTGEAVWTVKTKTLPQPIGLMSITKHKDGSDYELSYQFHPSHWGNAFALEASTEALRYALEELGHTRLIAETQVANIASCKLLERLGMQEVQRLTRFGAEQAIYAT